MLLTTQYLDEADRLADQIAVIDKGNLIAEGTSDELKAQVGGNRLEVKLEDSSQAETASRALSGIGEVEPESLDGTVRVPVAERRGAIAEAVRRLDQSGVGVDDIAVRRPTLDDVFMTLTGEHVEHADGEDEGDLEPEHQEAAR